VDQAVVRAGEVWAGTDNGLIHLTLDGGRSWTDVTPPDLLPWSRVSMIEASRFDASAAYVAVDRHRLDDLRPYFYRTRNLGKSWEPITAGMEPNDYASAIREDTERKGLLFAGTELRAYVSFDDGENWQSLKLNMPLTSIRDLAIAGDDLVAATHGRSFWILDNISPLRELTSGVVASPAFLFPPRRTIRIRRSENQDTPLPPETPVGENPPQGASLDYYLSSEPAGAVALEILASDGTLVRRYSSDDPPPEPSPPAPFPSSWLMSPARLSKQAGMHRFFWDLRYALPAPLHSDYSMAAPIAQGTVLLPEGPLALPGDYQVRLTASGHTYTRPLGLEQDPRVEVPRGDLEAQLGLFLQIREALGRCRGAYDALQGLRADLAKLPAKLGPSAREQAAVASLDAKVASLSGRNQEFPRESSGLVGAANALGALAVSLGSADAAPTEQERTAFERAQASLSLLLSGLEGLETRDLPEVNRLLSDRQIPPLHLARPSK